MKDLLSLLLAAVALAVASCSTAGTEADPLQPKSRRIQCADLPGASAVLAQTDKRFLIFGELHGTAEAPALFGDFVCAAARKGPIVVGIELPQDQQESLDRYLASDGSASARDDILRTPHWSSNRDGRASAAMLVLVERLRLFRASGLPIRVVTFVPTVADRTSQTPYEKAMAQQWRDSLANESRARFVALVGNIHTLRGPRSGFEPAAMHMPPAALMTFGPAPTGGEAWNCRREGCGAHSIGGPSVSLPRGIAPPQDGGKSGLDYDMWYSAGSSFTASAPAAQAEASE